MSDRTSLPPIIQGPDGAAGWRLARAVSLNGQLGVVCGNHVEAFLIRHLQRGDAGGQVRRLMATFPFHEIATSVQERCFARRTAATSDQGVMALCRRAAGTEAAGLAALAAFVEVRLAKEGHDNPIGISLSVRAGIPNLAVLYGAILAGADAVLIQGPVPRGLPGALDRLAQHQPVSVKLQTRGPVIGPDHVGFDPRQLGAVPSIPGRRPKFIAIVRADAVASLIESTPLDGVVVECGVPNGHRPGAAATGCQLQTLTERGLPYWVEPGSSEGCHSDSCANRSAGVYLRTLFAWCEEADHAVMHAGGAAQPEHPWRQPTAPTDVAVVSNGRDLAQLRRLLRGRPAYSAADVISFALRRLVKPRQQAQAASTRPRWDHDTGISRYSRTWATSSGSSQVPSTDSAPIHVS
ncbi:MAG: hypothetical protein ACYC2K_13190 [Gemmatimonadales bacterium]